jgi:hypothetical protein
VAEEKEKTEQKSYRLPVGQIEFIDLLAKRQILGSTGSAVVRTLLNNAIQELIKSEFVRKQLETIELLRKE